MAARCRMLVNGPLLLHGQWMIPVARIGLGIVGELMVPPYIDVSVNLLAFQERRCYYSVLVPMDLPSRRVKLFHSNQGFERLVTILCSCFSCSSCTLSSGFT